MTLPHARVLADALARHHPGCRLTALSLGGDPSRWGDAPFEVLLPADLGVPEAAGLATTHAAQDVAMILRPALLAHVGKRDVSDHVCFLTPDHDVLGPLDSVAENGAPIAIVRRVDGELPDDTFSPNPADLASHGLYSEDFIVVGPGARAQAFLSWYSLRLSSLLPRLAFVEPPPERDAARRHARRLLMLTPSLFGARPIDDPGLEASAWNLHARPLTREADGVLARQRPLLTLHFEGFDPQRPYWLSERADRVRVGDDPVLAALCEDYAARLLGHAGEHLDLREHIGRPMPSGVVFDARLLSLHEQALTEDATIGDVFTQEGCDAFMGWLLGPAPAGAQAQITRYLHRVYVERSDLPQAFPDLDGADGHAFASWAWTFGRSELAIPEVFLPPRAGGDPVEVMQPATAAAPPSLGVNVAGFFKGTLGLGEAARLYVRALDAAQVPVTTTTVDVDPPIQQADRRLGKDYGTLEFADLEAAEECAFNLICVNADEFPRFVAGSGADFFAARHSIGVWAWETDVIPERWDPAYADLDEIWVYSRFVAEHIGRASPVPVVCMPLPVLVPDSGGASSGIELPPGFYFMFMFDYFSTPRRKNPAGVIEAFKRAFTPGEGPQLLIKTIHGAARPRASEELRHAAAGRTDVHVIDCALSSAAKNALLMECDCYVSLHRSEGYGLTLAECMALGKPVIGTGYSGNLDFMSPANSYLVDYEMTTVGHGVEIYPPEGRWAEPDLDHAAALMRGIHADPDAARARGLRAQRDIAASLSPEAVGRIARARLERLLVFGAADGGPGAEPCPG